MNVLIIDDDELVRKHYAMVLQSEGYDIHTACTAADGLQIAATQKVDAVVLDLRMPLYDGFAFLRRFRALIGHQLTPVVIVTGDFLLDEKALAEMRYLRAELRFKPIWVDELADVVRAMLRSSREKPLPQAS